MFVERKKSKTGEHSRELWPVWDAEARVSLPPCSTQGTPADVLYKGTITRLITEDSASRMEREPDEVLSKGQVVYEGISGHILTYNRKCSVDWAVFSFSVKVWQIGSASFLYLSCAGSSSQTPKDEGRGLAQPGEILGLKRPYDVMEGGISRGLPLRDSLSTTSCEGKTRITGSAPVRHQTIIQLQPCEKDVKVFLISILSFKLSFCVCSRHILLDYNSFQYFINNKMYYLKPSYKVLNN